MKTFLLVITAIFILSGCTTRNAFEKFDLKNDQTMAVENSRSGKLIEDGKVVGLYSAVYLNNIYTNVKDTSEAFYISVYKKDGVYSDINMSLNSNDSFRVDELDKENQFKYLLSTKNRWGRYYLATFDENEDSATNILEIGIGNSSSGKVFFLKDRQ